MGSVMSVMEDAKQAIRVVTCEDNQPLDWFETVNTIKNPWRGMSICMLPDGISVPMDNPYAPDMEDEPYRRRSTVPPYGGKYSTDVRKWFRKK
jgi:hypothetical protein